MGAAATGRTVRTGLSPFVLQSCSRLFGTGAAPAAPALTPSSFMYANNLPPSPYLSFMEIRNNTQNGRFEIPAEGELAVLEYRLRDGNLYLMHTGVPDALGGRGIASALALHAFEYAKEKALPVVVYCPYVAKWLEKHPEWKGQVKA